MAKMITNPTIIIEKVAKKVLFKLASPIVPKYFFKIFLLIKAAQKCIERYRMKHQFFFSNQAAKRRITCKFISSKIDLNLSVGETESTVHMSNIANTL